MEKKIRLGIIGLGNMGSGHAKNLMEGKCPDFDLVAVADTNPARIAWGKENLAGNIRYFDDALAMLDSGCIDACMVCVPHYDHPRYAMACMQRGIHVMVEKPAGVYTKQVREMNAEAAKHPEVVFGMMFNQRTNHVYRKMRELVQSGQYGQIRRTNWIITDWYRPQAYYDSGAWRATWSGEGGGVLLNQCPHNLDLIQWICGMPIRVRAFCHEGKWHDIEVEDDVTAYLEYPNGATGVFVTTTGDAPGTNRFEITLEMGKLVCVLSNEGTSLTLYKLAENEREFCRTCPQGFEKPAMEIIEVETDGQNPQHNGVLKAFAANILRGEPLVAGGEEGINGLTLSNAMHLSSWLDRTVELPLDEELFLSELNKRRAASNKKEEKEAVTFDVDGTYGSKVK